MGGRGCEKSDSGHQRFCGATGLKPSHPTIMRLVVIKAVVGRDDLKFVVKQLQDKKNTSGVLLNCPLFPK